VSEVGGRMPVTVGFLRAARPFAASEVGLFDKAPGCVPAAPDYSDRVILLGRLKPGTALESRRVVHVFVLADADPTAAMTSLCGDSLQVSDMQWLPGMTGMPCEPCVMRGDGTGTPTLRASAHHGLPPAQHDPAVAGQRRLLDGMTPPPAGPDLSW
jgi:hypothetical protein